jgi:ApaG protein
MAMYEKITGNIAILVEPSFLDEQSSPEDNRYVWAYKVRIENRGRETVRLRSRYWRITDAHGQVQEVAGEGVVGAQPTLAPGENFEYTSGAPLPTPSGFMVGKYTMEDSGGRPFTVEIPAFSLDSPHQRVSLN